MSSIESRIHHKQVVDMNVLYEDFVTEIVKEVIKEGALESAFHHTATRFMRWRR